MPDRVRVEAPLAHEFSSVVRLIVGGVAERAALRFEEMDDLQLAIERLLAESGEGSRRVTLSFELSERGIRARVGPLPAGIIAGALQRPAEEGRGLTLARILETVVDSYGVEESQDGHLVVRLEKVRR